MPRPRLSAVPAALLAAAGFALLAACGGPASQGPGEPAGAGPAPAPSALEVTVHDGDFARIEQFVTPGGISVWLVNEPAIPIVSVNAAWEGGDASDPDGMEGLANAVTYQMNEGAGELDSLAFQTRMEELNMSFGCSAGRDWTSCSVSMLRENAGEAMDLVALAFAEPRFDEGPFERAKRETLVGIKQRETNPNFLAGEAIEDALYPGHPYAAEVSEESLAAITREAALAHKDRLMVRDRLLVTAVGAITPEALAPLVDKAFAGLPETSDLDLPPPAGLNPPVAEPIVVDLPQPQSLVRFIGPGLQRDHPDFFTAYVLNYTLGGGGFESRLMKELRVERGLTYGIYTGLDFGGELATWSGGGQTKNETAGEFVRLIRAELEGLAETGITETELADAKAYLTGSYPLGFDSNAKIAGNMMGVRQQGLGVDYFDRRNAAIEAVTLEDVNRVAAEWLKPERFTFVLVGEPDGLGAGD